MTVSFFGSCNAGTYYAFHASLCRFAKHAARLGHAPLLILVCAFLTFFHKSGATPYGMRAWWRGMGTWRCTPHVT